MEGGWFDAEAIDSERFDADLEMAELEAVGNAISHQRRAGVCVHCSAEDYHPSYPERGLQPGQTRCTDGCGRVFNSEDEWWEAHREARGF